MKRRVGLAMVLVLATAVAACGDGSPSSSDGTATSGSEPASATVMLPQPVQELDIDGRDYTFEITPDPGEGLKSGWTLVRFHNVGAEAHQVMFAHIKEGVDMEELAASGAGDSSGAGAIEFVDMVGGVSYIDPDRTTTALVNLEEGLVMAMCYVPDANGTAHALMGMTNALQVAPDTDDASQPETAPLDDEVLGTIELAEDGYQVPEDITTGWYHVTNTDTALHELSLLRLDEPVEDDQLTVLVDDLAANRTPEVGLEALGGMGAISPGFDGYLYLDLPAGDYLAVDFMPDPGEPRPHMLDGYYDTFTV
jgi:hypothetical protein